MIQKKTYKYRNLIEDQMSKANRVYDVHGKAKEKLAVVPEQFIWKRWITSDHLMAWSTSLSRPS